jgi:hypothetical protein
MPTKLGKGGAGQQNYVPKGNGDPSGEYGDNATGSNIHITFKGFKKPEPTSTSTEPKIELTPPQKITPKISPTETSIPTIKEGTGVIKKGDTLFGYKGLDEESKNSLENAYDTISKDFPEAIKTVKEYGVATDILSQRNKNLTIDQVEQSEGFQNFIEQANNKAKRYGGSGLTSAERGILLIRYYKWATKKPRFGVGVMGITVRLLYEKTSNVYFKDDFNVNNYKKDTEENFKAKWWASDKPVGIVYHELGHVVFNDIRENDVKTKFEVEKLYRDAILKYRGDSEITLSRYGLSSVDEFVAESFSAHYTGMNNPVAEKVYDLVKNYKVGKAND